MGVGKFVMGVVVSVLFQELFRFLFYYVLWYLQFLFYGFAITSIIFSIMYISPS